MTGVFPQVRCYFSPVLSPVSPRCCGHFFVAPPQPPTNFRCYFLPFSCWFPVLPPLSAVFAAIFPGFPPVFRRFSALRVLLRDNVHPHLEARLLSNPDHTFTQSQTLKLYQRLGGRFDWRFSTGSLLFLTGSLAGFSTLLRPFFCCAAAATHQFSLLFLTIFLLVPGSCAGYPPFFSALRVLLRDNVHPQLEACLLSNPDHTCTQSQTLKLYQRLGGRFDCQFSAHFPGSSSFLLGFLPVLRRFLSCSCPVYTLTWRRACFQTRTTRASNHRHSSCINDLEAALTGVFPQVRCYFSPVLSPVSPRCCGHFFVAPPQPPTNFRCYFLPFSCWFPVLPPVLRHFPRFLPQFSPVFRRFSALRVLLRDNVPPQLEARLLSNPDHTFTQSQTLKLYRRLGGRFDWRFSTGSLLFLTGSLAGFSTLLRPFFCCAAATHPFLLLFLTTFLPVTGSSAGSPPCVCYCATTYTLNRRRACFQTRTTRSPNHRHSSCINDLEAALTGVFPQVRCYFSPVLSPVSPRCCGHFFVAPPQPPTNFRCYFLPFSCWFPVLPPLSAVFAAIFPGFPPVFPGSPLSLLPPFFLVQRRQQSDDFAPNLTRDRPPPRTPPHAKRFGSAWNHAPATHSQPAHNHVQLRPRRFNCKRNCQRRPRLTLSIRFGVRRCCQRIRPRFS